MCALLRSSVQSCAAWRDQPTIRRNDSSPASAARFEFLPARARTRRGSARRRSRAAPRRSSGFGGQLFLAAQAGQPVDQQHAVQCRSVGLKPTSRAWSRGSRRPALHAQESRQVDDAVQVPAQVGHAEEPAVRVRHRHAAARARRSRPPRAAGTGSRARCTRPRARTGRASGCAPPAAARPAGSGVRAVLPCWPFSGGTSAVQDSMASQRAGQSKA